MKNTSFLLICTFLFGISCSQNKEGSSESNTQESDRPNVIIIYTDDHGFADLGIQGQEGDLKTPHLDKLAEEGALLTAGYVSAPQCIPSRAGLLAGRYQERFGLDQNQSIPFPLNEKMIAQRMKDAGYVTGMAGKWHLDPNHVQERWIVENLPEIANKEQYVPQDVPFNKKIPYMATEKGFDYVYQGSMHNYWANYTLEGERIEKQMIRNEDYRLDVQTQATVSFINMNHEKPFFFYLSYFGPHVPLEATEKYLSRFPGDMPERRRMCLAMLSAIDDGIGLIKETLRKYGIEENTIIFFAGDNGAPLTGDATNPNFREIPVNERGAWDGSLNTPWVGEKGMLSEGGIRTPFVINWPNGLPGGTVYRRPVISFDFAATSLALAGVEIPEELDGVNLIPYLTGVKQGDPHKALYWRFWDQAAVRSGDWKYLISKDREFLFNVETDEHEEENLIDAHPEIAKELRVLLEQWSSELEHPGIFGPTERSAEHWFDYYFEGE